MPNDEIGEIRRIRHQISEECGHDVRKVAAYYRQVEAELKESGTFQFEPSRDFPAGSTACDAAGRYGTKETTRSKPN